MKSIIAFTLLLAGLAALPAAAQMKGHDGMSMPMQAGGYAITAIRKAE